MLAAISIGHILAVLATLNLIAFPAGNKVHCLHIRDIYEFLEPAFMVELKTKLKGYVEVPA
jgi:hypothetical protein